MITLEKLCKQAAIDYKMKLEAGEKGIKNIVQWVHIIEDDEVSNFLHGNELIFTTGLQCVNEEWLINFVMYLHERKISGLVINIGPHVKKIPGTVINYCNEYELPLYTVPWETKLVDITRDFCTKIMHSEQSEENIVSIFKDIVFQRSVTDQAAAAIERRGYKRNDTYTVIAIDGIEASVDASTDDNMKFYIQSCAAKISEKIVTFAYEKKRIIILCDYTVSEVNQYVDKFNEIYMGYQDQKYVAGISDNDAGIALLGRNFKRATEITRLCKEKNRPIVYYREIGIYQILLEALDSEVLKCYYNKIITPIVQSDQENGTNYMEFIRVYLENNGSVQAVANQMFIHRNSVGYQLNKINKITGMDMSQLDVKLQFLLCFYIKSLI